jgi:2-dehydropantoate 2-reductase
MHGWALSRGGVDVTHIVRKGTLAQRAKVVNFDVMDLRKGAPDCYMSTYSPKMIDEVKTEDRYDLVVVATNHLQSVNAVREYMDVFPGATFLMFCANWRGPAEIDFLLPRSRYLWGYSVFSGARDREGVMWANIQKTFRIGSLPGNPPGMLDRVIDTFSRAGIAPEIKENMIEWLWIHHAGNAGMLGAMMAEGVMPDESTGMDMWVRMVKATKDAYRVLSRRGVDIAKYPDTTAFRIADDAEAAQLLRKGMLSMPHLKRTIAHSHADTNPGEMKRFCLDVIETGEMLCVDMPDLARLKESWVRLNVSVHRIY